VPDASAVAVASGEEARSGGGAGGADVIVGEVDAFTVKLIEVGSLDDVVSVATEVAVSLVVGDDKDDVGFWVGHG